MKKSLVSVLAVGLVMSLAAGCSSKANEENSNAAADDNGSKKIKIDMLLSSWKGGGWPDNNHPIIQYIDDKFNVDLQLQWVPGANFEEKLNVTAASGKIPDITRVGSNLFLKWAEQDVFLDLKPYLDEYPNLSQVAKPEEWALLNPKDKIFGIPNYETAQTSIYGRVDWMQKLGITPPSADEFTVDKFYEIAKSFALEDPDGNGKKDTYGFSATGNDIKLGISQLEAAFGLANGWKEADGELVPMETQSDEWKAFLTFMSKAYEEGVLDKDFITNTNLNEKYASGKIGFGDMHFQLSQQTNEQLQAISPGAEFVELSPPIGESGMRGVSTPSSGMNKLVISNEIDDEKRDRILELLDWWVSPEGEDILKNGIEGVHYQKKDDGTYEMTESLKAEGEGRQSLLWNWGLRNNSNTFNTYKWSEKEWADAMEQSITNAGKYPYKNASDGYTSASATLTEKGTQLGDQFRTAVIEIIAGKKPVDSIDDAIAKWKQDGGDAIIKEVNAAYQAKQ
ncbi:hypothetical protein [Paenibacillus sp. HB172176]|uniref:hypothetical protein n=1 Tax=Paenibacillus sp. HB172176 TaxID=2493690 RepID=UPI00143BEB11|nr:hypothetical protein [Paenibacillus sp. HB172176]